MSSVCVSHRGCRVLTHRPLEIAKVPPMSLKAGRKDVRLATYCHLYGGVEQLGSSLGSYPRGRWFKSNRPHPIVAKETITIKTLGISLR